MGLWGDSGFRCGPGSGYHHGDSAMLSVPAILLASAHPAPPPVAQADLRLDFTAALRSLETVAAPGDDPDLGAAGEPAPLSAEPQAQPEPARDVPFHRVLETGGTTPGQRFQVAGGPLPRLLESVHPDLNVPSLADLARQGSHGLPFGIQITIDPHCLP